MSKSKKRQSFPPEKPLANRLGFSAIHGIWLLIFTFFWLNQPFRYGDEMMLIRLTSGIRHSLFGSEAKASQKDFLFVNVAYDKVLIEKKKEGVPIGKTDITDRKKLAKFFSTLNQDPDNHKFLLCDIFFKETSPDDTILLNEMIRMKNFLIPYHKKSGQWEMPIFDVDKGVADYTTGDAKERLLKFALIDGMRKSIPLLMYETLHHARFDKNMGLYLTNGKPSLSSIIPDFRIRVQDLEKGGELNPFYINLGEVLKLPDVAVLELAKERIIVIGDFEDRDVHETVIGEMPGPLILANLYLALANGDHCVSLLFLIFLFAAYTFISYQIFFSKKIEEQEWLVRILRSVIKGKLIIRLAKYLLILGAFSVVSYFLFNIHINILLIALYLTFLDRTVQALKQNKQRR